ncbi:ZIP family metal transporter [Pseudidiomarina sp.]|uniref:ZIP family metal transporter n=1 Tax=Pseudidiomarina sp. TaxID=2081707 RepID=UPI00299D8494|nr:ZIP family metal transporter [Pseudidiomarina sp.]MDX1705439.1 ZIP family metal transporter [Pseudidiomarina sp.]
MSLEVNLFSVFIAALITALATGLGAIPLLLTRQLNKHWLSIGSAIAAGLMLAASHSLTSEGFHKDAVLTMAGMLTGLVLIVIAYRWIDRQGSPHVRELKGADAKKAFLIMGVMIAHSFAEGVGVGVSYGGGETLGVFITTAIAVHNIPEGLAIALILVPRGVSVPWAAFWAVVSSLPQPLMAIPSYAFVTIFEPVLPFGFGVAAGAMIWMVFAELVPDAKEDLTSEQMGAIIVLAFLAMLGIQLIIA